MGVADREDESSPALVAFTKKASCDVGHGGQGVQLLRPGDPRHQRQIPQGPRSRLRGAFELSHDTVVYRF